MKRTQQLTLLSVLLGAIVLAVFFPVVRHDFIKFDDGEYITENPHVLSGLSWRNVAWAFTTTHASNGHPLTWLSHMLDVQLFGVNPRAHHAVSLLLHAINSILLFVFLVRVTARLWRGLFVAGLFALHPLHVESVAWAAERKDVLSSLFFLLTLLVYVRYVSQKFEARNAKLETNPKSEVRNLSGAAGYCFPSAIYYLLALILFVLGLLSKPMLVTVPFILLLLDFWPLNRFAFSTCQPSTVPSLHSSSTRVRRLLMEKAPFLVLAAASGIITLLAQDKAVSRLHELPLGPRLASSVVSCVLYLARTFWPVDLAVFYPHRAVYFPAAEQWSFWPITGAITVLTVVSAAAVLLRRTRPWLTTGWFWYLVTLLPVVGIIQVGRQEMADRYTYIPLIGIFICLVWAACEGVEFLGCMLKHQAHYTSPGDAPSRQWRTMPTPFSAVMFAIGLVILFACTVATRRQLSYWKDDFTLFTHALAVTAYNQPAHYHVGVGLAKEGKYELAAAEFRAAVKLDPDDANAHFNLGRVLMQLGQLDEAVAEYATVIRLEPKHLLAHKALGAALWGMGRRSEAMQEYSQAIEISPRDAEAQCLFGAALSEQGRTAEAVKRLQEAIALKPDYAQAHGDLGLLLAAADQIPEAIGHFREQVRLQPGAQACYNLARASALTGDFRSALTNYYRAVALAPDWPAACNSLAWTLASAPDTSIRNGIEAVRLAQRACELTEEKDVRYLATLDAAYAEAGNFDQAIEIAEKVRTLALGSGNTNAAKAAQSRIVRYQDCQTKR